MNNFKKTFCYVLLTGAFLIIGAQFSTKANDFDDIIQDAYEDVILDPTPEKHEHLARLFDLSATEEELEGDAAGAAHSRIEAARFSAMANPTPKKWEIAARLCELSAQINTPDNVYKKNSINYRAAAAALRAQRAVIKAQANRTPLLWKKAIFYCELNVLAQSKTGNNDATAAAREEAVIVRQNGADRIAQAANTVEKDILKLMNDAQAKANNNPTSQKWEKAARYCELSALVHDEIHNAPAAAAFREIANAARTHALESERDCVKIKYNAILASKLKVANTNANSNLTVIENIASLVHLSELCAKSQNALTKYSETDEWKSENKVSQIKTEAIAITQNAKKLAEHKLKTDRNIKNLENTARIFQLHANALDALDPTGKNSIDAKKKAARLSEEATELAHTKVDDFLSEDATELDYTKLGESKLKEDLKESSRLWKLSEQAQDLAGFSGKAIHARAMADHTDALITPRPKTWQKAYESHLRDAEFQKKEGNTKNAEFSKQCADNFFKKFNI